MRRHPFDAIAISEEGMLSQCQCCGKYMPHVSNSHYSTQSCRRITRQRLAWARALCQLEAKNVTFRIGSNVIETVSEFRYLGRILQESDLDDKAVRSNLGKAQAAWGRIKAVLSADEVSPPVMGKFYKTIIQSVLLYGSESWVISQRLRRRLDSFHHRCARYMANKHIRQLPNGEWDFPDTTEVLEICKLNPLSTYIAKRKSHLLHNYAEPHCEVYRRCLSISSTDRRAVWWNA